MKGQLTADSITDADIEAFLDNALLIGRIAHISLAHDALGSTRNDGTPVPSDDFIAARSEIARLINARAAGKDK